MDTATVAKDSRFRMHKALPKAKRLAVSVWNSATEDVSTASPACRRLICPQKKFAGRLVVAMDTLAQAPESVPITN